MIFDVIVKVGKNAVGKDIFSVFRIHDRELSKYLREVQNDGHYILSVIPLFRSKLKDVIAKHILMQDESVFDKEYKEVAIQDLLSHDYGNKLDEFDNPDIKV